VLLRLLTSPFPPAAVQESLPLLLLLLHPLVLLLVPLPRWLPFPPAVVWGFCPLLLLWHYPLLLWLLLQLLVLRGCPCPADWEPHALLLQVLV
jgi:hypothetical protein